MREWGEWVREKVEGISVELVKTEKKTYWASMKCDVIFNDWFLQSLDSLLWFAYL